MDCTCGHSRDEHQVVNGYCVPRAGWCDCQKLVRPCTGAEFLAFAAQHIGPYTDADLAEAIADIEGR